MIAITKNQERALAALLSCPTQEAAAAKAGISSRTLRNYLKDPEFAETYRKASSQLITTATLQIQRGLAPAIGTLREIAEDREASTSARIQAARGLLEYGIRLSELGDIYARIEALETSMDVDKYG